MKANIEGSDQSARKAPGSIQPVQPPLRARLSRIGWLAAAFFLLFPKNFRGVGRARGEGLLRDVVDALDAAGVPFQIDYGTLLGCVREDRLIPWDEDIDLAVLFEDLPRLMSASAEARRRSLRLETYILPDGDFGDSGFVAGDVWLVRLVRPATPWFPREFYVDIEIRRRRDDRLWWVILHDGLVYVCSADAETLSDGRRHPFLGRKVTLPLQTEDYLTLLYGDWETPVFDYDSPQDGSIVFSWPIEPAG